jgi:DNA-binding NtrC family response regulator
VTGNAECILVVDDTPTNVGLLLDTLEREGFHVLVAADGASAIEQAEYARPALILLDVVMPGIDGFETCRRLKGISALTDTPVIFLSALDEVQDKLRAFKAGAVDYITKPLQAEEVLLRVKTHLRLRQLVREVEAANSVLERKVEERTRELSHALEEVRQLRDRLQAENAYLQTEISEHSNFRNIIGSSPALREALRKVDLVAPTDSTVLILGETGTGKELIARAIHDRSQRHARPLVKLNCSAISAGLVESELFGHVKGAFTGASERRTGRFELADGGTLFLDELGELPLETQAKLLRVLQEGEFEPVGSSQTRKVDVRVIAATNRQLPDDVAAGRFRADLFYRLNVFPIEMPPLRARREDVPLLARFFLDQASRRMGRRFVTIDPESMARLQAHDWPGNIRDLQNTIERAAILSTPPSLRIDWTLAGATAPAAAPPVGASTSGTATSRSGAPPGGHSLEDVERQHIIEVLRQTHGVIEGPRGAASILGLKPSTARFRMRKLGIRKGDIGLN